MMMGILTNEHWTELPVHRGFDEVKDVYDMLCGRGFIAGSYAAYMAAPDTNITPNDIDVFAVSNEAAESLANLIHDTQGIGALVANGVAYTITRSLSRKDVQIVKPSPDWKVFPDDIINSFDMNVCRAVLISPDKLLGDVDAGTTHGKLLRMHNPLRTLKRVMKYSQRGVDFTDHEILKVFRAWEEISAERKAEILDLAHAEAFPETVEFDYNSDIEYWYEEDEYWEGE
jgi:hypothetical protein